MFFFFQMYLKFVKFTSKITYENKNIEELDGCIVGFWHGESTYMYFLAEDLSKEVKKVRVAITEDGRGDVIEKILKKRGAHSLRVQYKHNFINTYKQLLELIKTDETLAFAMDGPTGPYKVPSKLIFDLSKKSNKNFVEVYMSYSKSITLNRWDKYKVPLPFSKIVYRFENYGVVSTVDEFMKLTKTDFTI